MAELADAPDLGSGVYDVQVQVLLSALNKPLDMLWNGASRGYSFGKNKKWSRKGAVFNFYEFFVIMLFVKCEKNLYFILMCLHLTILEV